MSDTQRVLQYGHTYLHRYTCTYTVIYTPFRVRIQIQIQNKKLQYTFFVQIQIQIHIQIQILSLNVRPCCRYIVAIKLVNHEIRNASPIFQIFFSLVVK
jgi:hypothetical protein